MRSADGGVATVTRPNELPPSPITEVGVSVSDAGGGRGVSVICDCTLTPCQLAVIVTGVLVVTLLVGMVKGAEKLPAGTVTVAGGLAAGELLERLTRAPPAGAWPFSITLPPDKAPPLMVDGMDRDCSDGGCTVNWPEAETPFRVAVSVTGVGTVTCPAVIRNCVQASLPGIEIVGGTGAAAGFELVSAMVAPPGGTPAVGWTGTQVSSPL